jgi:hypothetical protein
MEPSNPAPPRKFYISVPSPPVSPLSALPHSLPNTKTRGPLSCPPKREAGEASLRPQLARREIALPLLPPLSIPHSLRDGRVRPSPSAASAPRKWRRRPRRRSARRSWDADVPRRSVPRRGGGVPDEEGTRGLPPVPEQRDPRQPPLSGEREVPAPRHPADHRALLRAMQASGQDDDAPPEPPPPVPHLLQ